MGTVTVSLPADGSTGTVSQYNTPLTTVVNELNGNIDNANIKSGAAIATSKLATDNGIGATHLSSSAITLGYAQITTTFSTTSATAVQVTSLTATVTIPAGSRKIKITALGRGLYNGTAGNRAVLSIWDGTVGSGTQLAEGWGPASSSSSAGQGIAIAIVTPSAGSKTYNVGLRSETTGTSSIDAATIAPAFILVEAI
jgi:hypothetical protein